MQLITAGTQSSLDEACETAFGGSYYGSFLWIWDLEPGVNLVESTTTWHHLAVTWTAAQGLTKIYKDGLLLKAVWPKYCAASKPEALKAFSCAYIYFTQSS